MAQYPLDPRRTTLLFFDMLNHYIYPHDAEKARRIAATGVAERSVAMARAARAAGVQICHAVGSHRPDGGDHVPLITDGDMDLKPWPGGPRPMERPGATAGTREGEIIPELAPEPEDFVVPKYRWSAFAGTSLDLLLRWRGIDTILLAGGSTDVGIIATAYAARDLGYHLVILRDACQTQRPGAQEFCMGGLFPRMGRVMTVEQAIALLPAGAARHRGRSSGGRPARSGRGRAEADRQG